MTIRTSKPSTRRNRVTGHRNPDGGLFTGAAPDLRCGGTGHLVRGETIMTKHLNTSAVADLRIAWGSNSCGVLPGVREGHNATLVDLAILLDEASAERISDRGSYGNIGAGSTWVEAVFHGDDGEYGGGGTERIDSLDDAKRVVGALPFGSRQTARRQLAAWNAETIWDGHNHVPHPTACLEELLSGR